LEVFPQNRSIGSRPAIVDESIIEFDQIPLRGDARLQRFKQTGNFIF